MTVQSSIDWQRNRRLYVHGEIQRYCNTIKKYEHEADSIYRNAIAELFELNYNPIEVIKLKEIYENLEESVDKCQDVADIVEDIALKYG